jgi:hypothetical protein
MTIFEEEDEKATTVIDIIVYFLENLKWFILGPIMGALIALVISKPLETAYTSQALLKFPQQDAINRDQLIKLVGMPVVLDPVIESLKLAKGQPIEMVRQSLNNNIKVVVDKFGILNFEVTATQASQAQEICGAVLDSYFKSLLPAGQHKLDMERRLIEIKFESDQTSRFLNHHHAKLFNQYKQLNIESENSISIYLGLMELRSNQINEALKIQASLTSQIDQVIKMPPTLPIDPSSNIKEIILNAVKGALSVFFTMILWLYMRKVIFTQAAESDLIRLRLALGLRN